MQIGAEPEPLAPSGEVTYTVTFSNTGQGEAAQSVLSVVLPEGVEFISASDGGILNGDEVQWALGGVGSGQGGRRFFTVRDLFDQQGRVLRAEALVRDNFGDTFDARSVVLAAVQNALPLRLTLAVSDDPVQPEQRYYYTVTVGNTSTSTFLESLELSVHTPDHVFFETRQTTTDAFCVGISIAFSCEPGHRFIWEIETLAPGEVREMRIPVLVDSGDAAPFGSLIETQFQVDYDGSPALITTEETILIKRVLPPSDLDVKIGASPEPFVPGGEVTYTVTYGNAGQGEAAQSVLTVVLPENVELISATDGGVLIDNTVEWELGSVGSGQGGQRAFTVRDLQMQPGRVLRVEAHVRDNFGEAFDHRTTSGTAVQFSAPVEITVTSNDTELFLSPGQRFAYIVTVRNTSSSTFLETLEIGVHTPHHVFFETSQTTEPTFCVGISIAFACEPGHRFIWEIETLFPGETREVRIPAFVDDEVRRGSLVVAPFQAFYFVGEQAQRVTDTVVYVIGTAL